MPLEVEKKRLRVMPDHRMGHAHHGLVLLGRYVCKARQPECWRCGVRAQCAFKGKTTA